MSRPPAADFRIHRTVPGDPGLRERDERLESLKAVVGKLAHDFNNFLVPLLGYVSLIKEEVAQGSPALQYANTLESSARKTEGYIDSILLGMRPHRHFAPRTLALDAFVTILLEKWRLTLPDTSHVTVVQNFEPISATIDERHWTNAIEALLTNARFALATGGRFEITLKKQTLDEAARDRLGISAEEVAMLQVRDEGFGMSEEVRRRAFEPFFTTRAAVKAPGLGLTVVHSVVQHQGGQVELVSEPNKGTTVTMYIPFTPPGNVHRPMDRPTPTTPAGKHRILVVEDDPLVREVVKTSLQTDFREIYVAGDGQEALRTFLRYKTDWALVISDVSMPGMNGAELWARLTEVMPDLKFIFLTGDDRFEVSSLPGGNSESPPILIRKPFTLKSLDEVVDQLLAKK